MKLTKTTCLELLKKYVKGIENVKVKDMFNYKFFSEKRNLHFCFSILLSDDYELKVMVCNRKYGDVMIWLTLIHYVDSIDDDLVVEISHAFHIGVDEKLKYSTKGFHQIDVSQCL